MKIHILFLRNKLHGTGNIHPVNRHALHANGSDEHGILNSVGNFFGAIGKGVSNAASWMWETIKSPFTK
jgi:hypothetical protein